jgi:hypothetical protein
MATTWICVYWVAGAFGVQPTAAGPEGAASRAAVAHIEPESPSMLEPFRLDFGALQDEPAPEPAPSAQDEWRVRAEAWIWLMGIQGDLGARGVTASVSASFVDIIDAVDSIIAVAGRVEIAKGRFGGFVDGAYSVMGVDDHTVTLPDIDPGANINLNPDPGPGPIDVDLDPDVNLQLGPVPASIDVTAELAIIDFALTYRVGEWPVGAAGAAGAEPPRLMTFDAYAGGRYTLLTIEIDPANFEAADSDEAWIDPIFGAALEVPLGEQWEFRCWGDIGGFDVGSEFTWSAAGLFGYEFLLFDNPAAVYGGYRALGQDFQTGTGSDRFEWDVTLHGPLLGFSMAF